MPPAIRKTLSGTILIVLGVFVSSPITIWAFGKLNKVEPLIQSLNICIEHSTESRKELNTQLSQIALMVYNTSKTVAENKARVFAIEKQCDLHYTDIQNCEKQLYRTKEN